MAGERHEKASEARIGEARPRRAPHDNSKTDMTELDQDRAGLHIVIALRPVMKMSLRNVVRTLLWYVRQAVVLVTLMWTSNDWESRA